jgi:hypothetical protein
MNKDYQVLLLMKDEKIVCQLRLVDVDSRERRIWAQVLVSLRGAHTTARQEQMPGGHLLKVWVELRLYSAGDESSLFTTLYWIVPSTQSGPST